MLPEGNIWFSKRYALEASSDLKTREQIAGVYTDTDGLFAFVDAEAAGQDHRFYRMAEE